MIMDEKDLQFLRYVRDYVKKSPGICGKVSDAVSRGVEDAVQEANERAADMESLLLAFVPKKFKKWNKDLVLSKLDKWEGKTSLNWKGLRQEVEGVFK